jgi:hypothetical protein
MTATGMVAALIKAQQAFKPILKDNTAKLESKRDPSKSFSYKYADLGSVLDAVLPALHANGFALTQPVGITSLGEPVVKTTLLHESGERIESEYPVRVADPNDPQKVGGGVTFARRYSLIALLGLATEDDDANHARTPPPPRAVPTPIQNDEPVLFMSGPDTKEWTERVKAVNAMTGTERKDALNALYKEAAGDRNLEKIEVMVAELDYEDANKIASAAEAKGLMSNTALDTMIDRGRKRDIEKKQEVAV